MVHTYSTDTISSRASQQYLKKGFSWELLQSNIQGFKITLPFFQGQVNTGKSSLHEQLHSIDYNELLDEIMGFERR